MRIHTLMIGLCLFGLVAPSYGSAPLAEKLPASTLAYVGWAGRSLTFDGSMFGQLLEEPATRQIFGVISSAITSAAGEGPQGQMLKHVWSLAGVAWQHPAAIAVIDLSQPAPPLPVGAILLVDVGSDREAFASHIESLVELLGEDIPITDITVGQMTCRQAQLPIGASIIFGFKEDLFFMCLGDEAARVVVEQVTPKSLAAGQKFIDAFATADGDDVQMAFYVDATTLTSRIDSIMPRHISPADATIDQDNQPSEFRRILDALGLAKATAIVGSTRIVDRGMYTKTRLLSPAPHRGVLMPFAAAPLTDADLAGVPDDADFLLAMRMSPEATYAEMRRVIELIDPATDAQLAAVLAGVEGQVGVSLTDDILTNLGDVWLLDCAPSHGGFITGTLLTVGVRDAPALTEAVGKIEAFFQPSVAPSTTTTQAAEDPTGTWFWFCRTHPHISLEKRGTCPICGKQLVRSRRRRHAGPRILKTKAGRVEIHYLTMPGNFMPVAPAWAIHNDKLYLAAWPQVIAATIDKPNPPALTQEAAFRRVRQRIAGKPTILTYSNTPKIVRQVYNLVLVGWTVAANALPRETRIPMRPDWLPALSTLEKYLWPEMTSISADDEGITIEGYGSMPLTGLAGAPVISALPVSILLPSLERSRHLAKKTMSATNLSAIGKSIVLYMGGHDDQMPPDLASLVAEDYINAAHLVSPVSGRTMPTDPNGMPIGGSDYIYLRLDDSAPDDLILAYERPENYNGEGTNVLRAGFNVSWVTQAQFEHLLARTKEWMKINLPALADPDSGKDF